MEKKVLGKGLSALITKTNEASQREISSLDINSSNENVATVKTISILENRFQPRQTYAEDKLAELKASIKEKGVLQPILVRQHGNGYEVVAGERRLRAAKALGLEEVPVIVKNVSDQEALVLALVENIQREELNAIEEAQGYKRLMDEFHFNINTIAEAVGKDSSTVQNLVRLLRLPPPIQQQVVDAKISMGHARALISIESAEIQKRIAEAIIEKGLSVRQVEEMSKKALQAQRVAQGKNVRPKDRDIQILEEELQRILGTKVSIKDRKGKGKLLIEYYTLDDLDRILGVLRK